jgi:virulence-associated protein VagC
MDSAVLQSEGLNLPEYFAQKFKGKKVELIEKGDQVVIAPIINSIDSSRGILKGSSLTVQSFIDQKKVEKDIEYVR